MIGPCLKRYRKIRKVTQLELAQWLGVSRQAISMWESGKRELKVTTLSKIAKVFNVSLNEILQSYHGRYDLDQKEEAMAQQLKTKPQSSNKILFVLKAPEAKRVALTGDFKTWSAKGIPLKRNKDGLWKTELDLKPGRYEYKFIVDDQWWLDPGNKNTSQNSFGTLNSVIQVG